MGYRSFHRLQRTNYNPKRMKRILILLIVLIAALKLINLIADKYSL